MFYNLYASRVTRLVWFRKLKGGGSIGLVSFAISWTPDIYFPILAYAR